MTYIKSLDDKSTTPILTAIDVETGMSMATLIQNRTQHFEYLVNCMRNFLMESGRAQAILANTVLQSDQEQFLINLLKATALRLGNNISAVRQSAAYNSQSQGSVERFHRTLISQIRSLRAQVKQYYDRDINCEQPLKAVASTAFQLLAQPLPHSQRWQHQLLQTLGKGTQNPTLHLCRNSSIHGSDSKDNAKA